MRCPECDEITKVVDSRRKPGYIYRRRQCGCGTRFSTREIAFNVETPAQVEIKRLEELNKLIDSQIEDANQSMRGKMVRRGGKSVKVDVYLDAPDRNGRSKYDRMGG